jgi:hypothetical protein
MGELHISDRMFGDDLQYQRRKATCLTIEDCDLLAISKELSHQLYQPEVQKPRLVKRDRKGEENQEDELNSKIAFLQSVPLFEDIESSHLMPIACNMIPKSFSFGEFILKEGEIPKGLYLIKSGQCKVGSTRIAERPIKGDFDLNKKLGERKKITDKSSPLFHEFDPENSLLNVIFME